MVRAGVLSTRSNYVVLPITKYRIILSCHDSSVDALVRI